MYKRIFLIVSVLALATLACSITVGLPGNGVTGSGKVVTETRPVQGFDQVELASFGDVYLEQGDNESLSIEGDDNILPLITTEVSGSRLVIGTKPGASMRFPHALTFRIVIKDLKGLEISGSGKFITQQMNAANLKLGISGSGDIRFDQLTAQSIDASIAGSGNIQLTGSTDQQSISIGGSGDYNAGNLESKTAEVRVDGSGNTTLWVSEQLDVMVNGSGNVNYYGSPQTNVRVNGSGKVKGLGSR